jgi:hypothetical protein
MDKVIADTIVFGLFITLGVSSVVAAVFRPELGILNCILLAAYFFDANKRVFRTFFVSPKIFFRKNIMLTAYHRAAFFSFLIAFIVNLAVRINEVTFRWFI